MPPLIEVTNLKKHFPIRKGVLQRTIGAVRAVDGISFSINEGETLGLVGESGCGKTTVGRTVLRLVEPTSGEIKVRGQEISGLSKAGMRPLRRQMQIIFQDPFSSLNPRIRVGEIVGEPLKVHGVGDKAERADRVASARGLTGIDAAARLTEIPGIVPPLNDLPPGCAFSPRCPRAVDECRVAVPPFEPKGLDHSAACWRV